MQNISYKDNIDDLPIDNIPISNNDQNIIDSFFPAPKWYKKIENIKHIILLSSIIIIMSFPQIRNNLHNLITKIPLSLCKNSKQDSMLNNSIVAILTAIAFYFILPYIF